jgi:hypothetical protein
MPRWKDRLTDPAPDAPSLNEKNNGGMLAWAKACTSEDERRQAALATSAPLVARQVGEGLWVVSLTDPNTREVFSGCFCTPTPDREAF